MEDAPIVRALRLATAGWGYNFYDRRNQARADDLLVREKAAHSLGEAAAALTALESDYRREFVPASTRDSPFPPPEKMARLRAVTRLRERVAEVAGRIRSASVPTQDRIWARLRDEKLTLLQLLSCDHGLIEGARKIAELARAITPEAWEAGKADPILDEPLIDLDRVLRERTELLQMPTM